MKIKLIVISLLIFSSNQAYAEHPIEWGAGWKKIDRIQIPTDVDIVYLVEYAGWQLATCPAARYATISKTSSNFDAVYSLAMMAYAQGKKINIRGKCRTGNLGVIDVDYLVIQTDTTE